MNSEFLFGTIFFLLLFLLEIRIIKQLKDAKTDDTTSGIMIYIFGGVAFLIPFMFIFCESLKIKTKLLHFVVVRFNQNNTIMLPQELQTGKIIPPGNGTFSSKKEEKKFMKFIIEGSNRYMNDKMNELYPDCILDN